MNSNQIKQLCNEWKNSIRAYVNDGCEAFKNDYNMVKMYKKDQKDLNKCVKLLNKKDRVDALWFVLTLDEAVQKSIPISVWNYLMEGKNV